MARRAYRTAMRSGNVNELAAAANMVNDAGGRFMGPGETERRVDLELERRTATGELGRSRLDQEPGLGGLTKPLESISSDVAPRLSAAEESKLKTRELTLAGNFGPRAQRELESIMAREEGGSLFQKSSKEDALRFHSAYADQKRAEDTAFFNSVEDEEKGIEAKSLEAKRIDARNGVLDSVRESRIVANPALDAAMSKLEEVSNRTKESGDNREKATLERRAAFDARGKEIEATKASAIAAAEGRYDSALGGLEKRAKVRKEQTKVTDDYFAAAELESPTGDSLATNYPVQVLNRKQNLNIASAYNDTIQGVNYPFKPHGIDSGSLKAESSDALQYKKAIERGNDFNAALGGKEVTMRYNERNGRKIMSPHGDKAVSFQADAFTSKKNLVLGLNKAGSRRGDGLVDTTAERSAMDQIIKAAVDNKYPIELDAELMAVPEFKQKLTDARVKSGMKTDKITGYTSFSFD